MTAVCLIVLNLSHLHRRFIIQRKDYYRLCVLCLCDCKKSVRKTHEWRDEAAEEEEEDSVERHLDELKHEQRVSVSAINHDCFQSQ